MTEWQSGRWKKILEDFVIVFLRVWRLLSNDFKGVALRKIQFNEEILTDRSADPIYTPSAAGLNSFILAYFYYMEKKFDVPGILHLESKVWYICRWSVMKFLILEWWAPPSAMARSFWPNSLVKWLKIGFFWLRSPLDTSKCKIFLQIPPEPKSIVKTKALEKKIGSIAQKMTEIWAI